MTRLSVVTGSASGIGRATAELLRARGEKVIGVDLRDAEIVGDLGSPEGRRYVVSEVERLAEGPVDAVHVVAGVLGPHEATVAVNYFGALATLELLRSLLSQSASPRATVVSSLASLKMGDPMLLGLLEAGDEMGAIAHVSSLIDEPAQRSAVYSVTKNALTRWVRRQAPSSDWAGAGIALNAVAPGVIDTPMNAIGMSTPEGRQRFEELAPMPLNGIAQPEVVARLLSWLGSAENTHVTGQVIFIDGGAEALARGDTVW